MSDDPHAPTTAGPVPAKEKAAQVAGQARQVTGERPEILVGVAFAGGFVAAMILKRLGR